jgi:hypothetical protein
MSGDNKNLSDEVVLDVDELKREDETLKDVIQSLETKKHILELALRVSTSFYYKKSKVNSALNSLNQKFITQEKFDRIYNNNEVEKFTESDEVALAVVDELKRVLFDIQMDDLELSMMVSRNIAEMTKLKNTINH